ncbi:phage portal protein [Staphylococcus devriesei]|uniref:phage portal protein n=1 Tax=Staphylococcus devriesei TaxID=586733 RepID=UPI000E69A548|nr:phage portal protein [Staphylococcus devriesei]RIL71519.1 phage portal protein [Staphylococcus devriesei]
MGLFDKIFQKNKELSWMYDLELLQDTSSKAYIKRMAINTVIEFVARTLSQSEFRIKENDQIIKDSTYYLLNVRPNPNQNATQFWQKFIYKLLIDNEALIIKSDDDYFYVADNFERETDLGLLPQKFNSVTINDYIYNRYFSMEDVIYVEYANEKLDNYLVGLFEDYGEVFGRMLNMQLKQNQIRGVVNVESTTLDSKSIQDYIDMIFNTFEKNQVAVIPLTKGLSYEEHSTKGSSTSGSQFGDLRALVQDILIYVARLIGVTPSLILGENADLEKSIEATNKFCFKPLMKKIETELNAKLFFEDEFIGKNKRIEIIGIDKKNPLELSEAVDKLRSSGTYTGNQIRVMLGDEPGDDPHLDEYVLTKNYEAVTDEGGEAEK